ncbi:MAG: Rpp14/Pop5 family protein [Candidatus Bathyarchaeota archaeon]|nr:MAG: Rpp14/Pop5 family protein [Candidatus Bathyarchaeota archaeon]
MRRRYIAVTVASPHTLKDRDLMNAIWESVHRLFGELGASQTALSFIEYNELQNRLILRCSHDAVDSVRAAIAAITTIHKAPTALHVTNISGTLKRLRVTVEAHTQKGHSR